MESGLPENGTKSIDCSDTLNAFFTAAVTVAWIELGLKDDPPVKQYLADLLERFSPTQEDAIRKKPLLRDLMWAPLMSDKSQRIAAIRGIADAALVAAGLFAKFFARKIVGVRSYVSVAERGYGTLVQLVGKRDGNLHAYRRFSTNALPYALILRNVWTRAVFADGDVEEIVRVCKAYLVHKRPEDKKWLEAHGISLLPEFQLDRLIIL